MGTVLQYISHWHLGRKKLTFVSYRQSRLQNEIISVDLFTDGFICPQSSTDGPIWKTRSLHKSPVLHGVSRLGARKASDIIPFNGDTNKSTDAARNAIEISLSVTMIWQSSNTDKERGWMWLYCDLILVCVTSCPLLNITEIWFTSPGWCLRR